MKGLGGTGYLGAPNLGGGANLFGGKMFFYTSGLLYYTSWLEWVFSYKTFSALSTTSYFVSWVSSGFYKIYYSDSSVLE